MMQDIKDICQKLPKLLDLLQEKMDKMDFEERIIDDIKKEYVEKLEGLSGDRVSLNKEIKKHSKLIEESKKIQEDLQNKNAVISLRIEQIRKEEKKLEERKKSQADLEKIEKKLQAKKLELEDWEKDLEDRESSISKEKVVSRERLLLIKQKEKSVDQKMARLQRMSEL